MLNGWDVMQRIVRVGSLAIGNDLPFVLIAGPCQIESRGHALEVAARWRNVQDNRRIDHL